jgi:hypothetical protein
MCIAWRKLVATAQEWEARFTAHCIFVKVLLIPEQERTLFRGTTSLVDIIRYACLMIPTRDC